MSSEAIRINLQGPLARITIERPPLNILGIAELDQVAGALERADAAEETRLVRLDARGKVFCAGVDVGDHLGDKFPRMMRSLERLFDTFESMRHPSFSVVHGAALGGGCELTLGTDLCFASERASFGQPEILLGLFAPLAAVLLPRRIGERRALELLLSGEKISASEAERIGLVNRVFAEDRLESEVEAIQEKLMCLSGAALFHTKRAVKAARSLSLRDAHGKVNRLYMDELMRTADATEGLQAFLEKRDAVWRHA